MEDLLGTHPSRLVVVSTPVVSLARRRFPVNHAMGSVDLSVDLRARRVSNIQSLNRGRSHVSPICDACDAFVSLCLGGCDG